MGQEGMQHHEYSVQLPLKVFNINPDTWQHAAVDRSPWRSAIFRGAMTCKATRTAVAEQWRQARKARGLEPPTAATIPCPHCQRTFRAQIGLTSHLPTHRPQQPQPLDD
ncbi:hypothetical protein ACOMHN_067263 [Nucella lapillus]